jgi:hypothetical protein
MFAPPLDAPKPANQATSEIIESFSNSGYGFLDVSVGFCISFPLALLEVT